MLRMAASVLLLLGLPTAALRGQASVLATADYVADFDSLWTDVQLNYAYWHLSRTDWTVVKDLYREQALQVASTRAFVQLMERVLAELHDPHAHLLVNTAESPRLIPTDADIRATWRSGKATVSAVRDRSAAQTAGVRVGDEILGIGGTAAGGAIQEWMPRAIAQPDAGAQDRALVAALAGRRHQAVQVDLRRGTRNYRVAFRPLVERAQEPLTVRWLADRAVVIRVNNALGDTALIRAWDAALDPARHARGIILDLRDTPSGGNTLVGRGIMSRLVCRALPYQRHELVAEQRRSTIRRIWTEYVAPRGPFLYRGPVVVMVGGWTASMGEGIAIGLDGTRRAVVVGDAMAGLLGATYTRTMPRTGLRYNLPMERLSHVDGRAREAFLPHALQQDVARDTVDPLLTAAHRALYTTAAPVAARHFRTCSLPGAQGRVNDAPM